jgi:hypothetical protein
VIYDDTPLDEFIEKYGLGIDTAKCQSCGKIIWVDVPIRIKGYAGLEMRKHGCPDNFLSAQFVPIGEKEKSFWGRFLSFKRGKDE